MECVSLLYNSMDGPDIVPLSLSELYTFCCQCREKLIERDGQTDGRTDGRCIFPRDDYQREE